jgi:PD-(D/E)XK nuclease superfamily
MNANERESINALIERVVGAIHEVANMLGAGFLEKEYQRALVVKRRVRSLRAEAPAAVRIL